MRRILVTAISGDVSNEILKILQETEDEIFGCDVYDYPVGMDRVINFWKSEWALSPNYLDSLLEKCKEFRITHIIPVNEMEIAVINKERDRFTEAGIKLIMNDSEVLKVFLNKYETVNYLKQINGVCVPQTYRYNDFIEDGKEYIVKLNSSCGSKYLKRITRYSEIDLDEREDFVIQEYIPDSEHEYTVGVFSNGMRLDTIIFKRKLKHGYTSFVELIFDEEIKKDVERIAKKIHLKGFVNVQLRKYQGKNYIFEINPRISGTAGFRHQLGFRDVLWWLDLVDGKVGYDYEAHYKSAIGLRELNEKFVILK